MFRKIIHIVIKSISILFLSAQMIGWFFDTGYLSFSNSVIKPLNNMFLELSNGYLVDSFLWFLNLIFSNLFIVFGILLYIISRKIK